MFSTRFWGFPEFSRPLFRGNAFQMISSAAFTRLRRLLSSSTRMNTTPRPAFTGTVHSATSSTRREMKSRPILCLSTCQHCALVLLFAILQLFHSHKTDPVDTDYFRDITSGALVNSPIMLVPQQLSTLSEDERDSTVNTWLQEGRAGFCDF